MRWLCELQYGLFLNMLLLGLFASSCTKDDSSPEVKLAIGDTYEGGIIFYLDDTKQHGLVCAPTDQSTSATWSNGSDITTGAVGSDIGTGQSNTTIIVNLQGDGNYAAKICDDLVLNGYDDWFLPSKSECFSMYFNLKIYKNMGDFSDNLYWSSTESTVNLAYSQYANDGYGPTGGYYKSTAYSVRAVRAF
jgi:hypothetical protein